MGKKKNKSKKPQNKNAGNANIKSSVDSEPSLSQQDTESAITEQTNDAKSETNVSGNKAFVVESKDVKMKFGDDYNDAWFEAEQVQNSPDRQKETSTSEWINDETNINESFKDNKTNWQKDTSTCKWADDGDTGYQNVNESFEDEKAHNRNSKGKHSQGRSSHSSRNSSEFESSFSRHSYENSKNSSTSSTIRRSGQERDEDDREYLEFCKFFKSKCEVEGVLTEKQGDLFEMPEDYALAHCVAEDMSMGSGIAVTFRQNFKKVDELLNQNQRSGGLAVLNHNGRFIYYLVTKKRSTGKPTMETLCKSLQKMRQHMLDNKVEKLAMPRIGCGLDRLEWSEVKVLIEFIFKNIDVEIVICNFQQALNDVQNEDKVEPDSVTIQSDMILENTEKFEEYEIFGNYVAVFLKNIASKSLNNVVSAQKEIFQVLMNHKLKEQESSPDNTSNKKLRKAKIVDVQHPLTEMEAETMLIYFGSVDGNVNKQINELDKKFNFILKAYKEAKRELGCVIKTDIRHNVYLAHGCIIKEKESDPFNFKYFQKCLQEIKKYNKQDQYYYVAFEPFYDKRDNMLTEKILTQIRYTLFDCEIHVCWTGEMLKFMPKTPEKLSN